MLKNATTLLAAFGLFLAPTLIAQTTASPAACPTTVSCLKAPEPSAVPELIVYIAAIGGGYWLLRRKRKPVQQ
jgi:hypothetical protein